MKLPFVIRSSAIHGRGAFATRFIAAGSRIGEYAGERITKVESLRRFQERHRNGEPDCDYTFGLDSETVIDGLAGGNGTAFINHSCEPNCVFIRAADRVFIDARIDIPKGAELLIDYKLRSDVPMPDERLPEFACHCGAPSCRGTMLMVGPIPQATTAS
jgi:SET domain-containing protein